LMGLSWAFLHRQTRCGICCCSCTWFVLFILFVCSFQQAGPGALMDCTDLHSSSRQSMMRQKPCRWTHVNPKQLAAKWRSVPSKMVS
jgi:hypothetical protein